MKCIDACTKNRREYIRTNVPERYLHFYEMKYKYVLLRNEVLHLF